MSKMLNRDTFITIPPRPLQIPITSMDGRAIEKCLDLLNPQLTVEAKGELLSMIRELHQLRTVVEMVNNAEKDRSR